MAVTAALIAGSVALLGFGLDSFVETLSGGIILWRVYAEQRSTDSCRIEELDRRARKGVSLSLWALAAFVVYDATNALVTGDEPETSIVGIVLLVVSIGVMRWLAHAKRKVARQLHSHALEADATQTDICWWLSIIALTGLGLNAALGWWWADPAAALGLAGLIAWEAREAWRGEDCCD